MWDGIEREMCVPLMHEKGIPIVRGAAMDPSNTGPCIDARLTKMKLDAKQSHRGYRRIPMISSRLGCRLQLEVDQIKHVTLSSKKMSGYPRLIIEGFRKLKKKT